MLNFCSKIFVCGIIIITTCGSSVVTNIQIYLYVSLQR